ncbi:rod shape-determining protein MreC [Nocardiopsis terrae]|uniref:Cell shape-determining protein MreC n=1 Tax=Nocardiopsis terrae TaxID=372655 RepID=A0ABR9HDR4_9ACTN|nr:rod shape-determining protein MreC [Nocardiopsis terrae]MBE1457031.1 rod shape-determining protein MreC [Nocardiopsis terrae]GHC90238.1 rod shape-determining protein MreC [Nocardiopsis terrae]
MFRDSPQSRLFLAVLVVAAVVLIAVDARPGSNPVTALARGGGELVFAPTAAGVGLVTGPAAELYEAVRQGPEAADRIAELEEANAELESQLAAARLDDGRADQLDELLHLSGLGSYEVVPAQAVTRTTARGYAHTVTIDAGTGSGIRPDMTVVNGSGLVGRVIEAGPRTSTVRLATDVNSTVGARLEQTRKIGAVTGGTVPGGPEADMTLELFDMEAPIESGDRVVTLGSHDGAPFVPGVPVGTVDEVQVAPGALSRIARITPAVDFSSLDVVGVVVGGPEEDPRDSVLPPKPEPEGDR